MWATAIKSQSRLSGAAAHGGGEIFLVMGVRNEAGGRIHWTYNNTATVNLDVATWHIHACFAVAVRIWDRSYFADGVHPAPKAREIFVDKYWSYLRNDSVANPWLFTTSMR